MKAVVETVEHFPPASITRKLGRLQAILLIGVLTGLSLAGYLLASSLVFRPGFPLDDAWIHQTYARNLARHGEWSYWPGQPSAGSTAPLWSALLAVGHVVRLSPLVSSNLLGWISFWGLAVTGFFAFRILCPERETWAPWAGILLGLEWHLAWAAGSGMETVAFATLVLIVLAWLVSGPYHWFRLGLLIGLSAWLRPDGVTLLGPALFVLLSRGTGWRRVVAAAKLASGLGILFAPYLLFNRLLAGAWWPNTFIAKQAEYAILRQAPLWQSFLNEAVLPLVGVGAVLLPGFVFFIVYAYRRRAWGVLAGAAWLAGYLFLYAWRLPVTYQHGRYIIPAMPVFFLWGAAGVVGWLRPGEPVLWRRVIGKSWLLSVGLVLLVFWALGARAYARDVAFIETEMVDTAHWVAANTLPEELVAAHDIGALGYFGQRQLVDLAGLVSPEVIPFMRDESRLAAFLDSRRASYLVTFPGWYPDLARRGTLIYTSRARFSPETGGENMAVYRWLRP